MGEEGRGGQEEKFAASLAEVYGKNECIHGEDGGCGHIAGECHGGLTQSFTR